ncbi:S26 family signal peptidase [Streptomyces katsurahamanus]|uniref:S26 family signal peptidase n=1 Tax=Streptomyces katsurahamanus TaxID=2577098 RepID=UPI001E5E1EF4|nr:S26 family signal peptidase [Streptomyces katsurahamanus]
MLTFGERGGRGAATVWWTAAGAGVLAALAGAAWSVRRGYVAVTVVGESMSPALLPGHRVLIRRGCRGLRPGRIAVIAAPDPDPARGWRGRGPAPRDPGAAAWNIKRVAAVAGDPMPPRVAGGGERVPPGHVVVIGDRPLSQDSKQYGPCPVDQVLGVVVRRL